MVAANSVNMALRIVFNLNFIGGFFGERGVEFRIGSAMPEGMSVAAAVVAPGLLRVRPEIGVLRGYGDGVLEELVSVGMVAGTVVTYVLFFERRFLVECYRLLRPGR